ncbi:hypothetical protein DDZ13_02410 [Coraliomargarita sinensis]|uniref:Zinc-finger domain-containing protein n=1 Tax=Coraliomargarita sinensis TaxID=2174842 RepID=A0A317ZL29_9BACT|nr:hypothetical protein [Coraliomargarita sinensis]PXA05742.1 hypothetical protein DDZ13_02410 [Coraliomargarita sinensis]
MTDDRFTELVNLYFDKEISAQDLKRLKAEIAASPDRKRAFTERCRLDKAMRMALKPSGRRSRRRSGSRSGRRAASGRSRSGVRLPTKVSALDESMRAPSVTHFPRWLLASGAAASVVLGLVLLPPVFRDTTDRQAQPARVGVSDQDLVNEDPLAALGKSELRRYASIQEQREAKRHASLIAQMRLMGLRPEHTPEDKQLREVNMAAVHTPEQRVSQAELFQRIQTMKAMPEMKLLRLEEVGDSSGPSWSGSYEPSLVSFEEL